jgi:hypothetical protein
MYVEADFAGCFRSFTRTTVKLLSTHLTLDQAVFAAYGWPEGIGYEEILKNLLALNLERSSRKS